MNHSNFQLSKREKGIVEEIKKHLTVTQNRKEAFISDYFVLRFLRARQWNPVTAIKMIQNYFDFRDKMTAKMGIFREKSSKNDKPFLNRPSKTGKEISFLKPLKGRNNQNSHSNQQSERHGSKSSSKFEF